MYWSIVGICLFDVLEYSRNMSWNIVGICIFDVLEYSRDMYI